MAKRKSKPVSRVSPAVVIDKSGVLYDDMSNGDCFIYEEDIWMKVYIDDQEAIRLTDGYVEDDFCIKGRFVPVNIKVTWSKK